MDPRKLTFITRALLVLCLPGIFFSLEAFGYNVNYFSRTQWGGRSSYFSSRATLDPCRYAVFYSPFSAGVFWVNTTAEGRDVQPGDSVCETAAGNGLCALRAAIQEANALDGAETICLPKGVYLLDLPPKEEDNAEGGDLDITSSLTIVGAGKTLTTLDAGRNDRVFDIAPHFEKISVSLSGLKITNGLSSGVVGGGGILNRATLRLFGDDVSDNESWSEGGGIANRGGFINLVNSEVARNVAATSGGGVWNDGRVTLDRSTVSNNTSSEGGGGLDNDFGSLIVTRSTLSGNTGSGIANSGTLSLSESTLANNEADQGGGLLNSGQAFISRSAVTDNFAFDSGGGIHNALVDMRRGQVVISNSTLSGNVANHCGGGLCNQDSFVFLDHVTIADNATAGRLFGGPSGGGIGSENGLVHLRNTLIASNQDDSGQAPDCYSKGITSMGFNLVQDPKGCGMIENNPAEKSLTGMEPFLGPLNNNGGFTKSQALRPESPAVDVGNCTDRNGKLVPSDQRGTKRPQGKGCDIGAYESP